MATTPSSCSVCARAFPSTASTRFLIRNSAHLSIPFCVSNTRTWDSLLIDSNLLSSQSQDGRTALLLACYHGRELCVRALCAARPPPNLNIQVTGAHMNGSKHGPVREEWRQRPHPLILDFRSSIETHLIFALRQPHTGADARR